MSVAPTGPPANVTAFNKSAVAVMVFWERIPRPHRNGIVEGYKVCYKRADSVNSVMYCTAVHAQGIELGGLKPFTPYWVTVLGYTRKGEGPTSEPVKVWTDQFGELCVRNGKLSEASHRKVSVPPAIWVSLLCCYNFSFTVAFMRDRQGFILSDLTYAIEIGGCAFL